MRLASATAEGSPGSLSANFLALPADGVDARPFPAFGGAVQLQVAIHVAAGAGAIEAVAAKARAQPPHAVAPPDVRQALCHHIDDPQVGHGVHGGDATAGHDGAVREDDRTVVELHAGLTP